MLINLQKLSVRFSSQGEAIRITISDIGSSHVLRVITSHRTIIQNKALALQDSDGFLKLEMPNILQDDCFFIFLYHIYHSFSIQFH